MADFDDGKDDGALRTIGEVSDALDIKPHVLRYWEQQFSLLKPLKRSGGRRYYRPSDVELVETIDRLVNQEGYTLKGAEAVLRSSGGSDLDRRKSDRRSGDRRASSEQFSGEIANTVPDLRPKMKEAVSKLKAIRSRLANAIEA
ncbi:MerR family transcriptional regulator [Erythrobacter sp. THAF29]|uniref:MerR family transcriptional regulator n=1 Tax=Erythrobacter sp. THAF29 TaxID=2587851 RepID=UPI0012697FA7|nr:MerR family transcriptional regulator [Erythrobacter sp. THAF29]QFT78353.1 HTH-type transcriptional repressor YcgE [Erythrobacter sp. THAF29]